MFPPFEEDRMPDEHAHYIWFGPETVRALKAQLDHASDDAILIVRGHGEHTTLEVSEPGAMSDEAKLGVLNEAHICPPVCP
jgi:hypothetical protein